MRDCNAKLFQGSCILILILSKHEITHFIHPTLSAKSRIMWLQKAVVEYIIVLRLLSVADGSSVHNVCTFR